MVSTRHMADGSRVPDPDDRVVMYDVSWQGYEAQLAIRGEHRQPRIAYLDGALELVTTSRSHERLARWIAHLVVAYAEENGIELGTYGSWTLQRKPRRAGAEPDECYIVGPDQSKDIPDLAIEVVWTHGGIDKLEIYRRLGVREVWFWIKGAITVHVLTGDRYRQHERSSLLPDLDLALLATFLDRPTVTSALRDYRAALRG